MASSSSARIILTIKKIVNAVNGLYRFLEKIRWRVRVPKLYLRDSPAATDLTVVGFHHSPPTQKTIDRKVREREGERE
jgi:hypothetical protein